MDTMDATLEAMKTPQAEPPKRPLTLRETALLETLQFEHSKITINPRVDYCQLSFRGLTGPEFRYVEERGACPICEKPLHIKARSDRTASDSMLLGEAMKIQEKTLAASRTPVAVEPNPGPVIALKDLSKPDPMFDFTVPAESPVVKAPVQ